MWKPTLLKTRVPQICSSMSLWAWCRTEALYNLPCAMEILHHSISNVPSLQPGALAHILLSFACVCLIETPATSEVSPVVSVRLWLICFMSLFVISFLSLFWNTKNLPHPLFSGNSNHCCRGTASFHLSLKDNYNLFYENHNGHRVWLESCHSVSSSIALMILSHTEDVSKKHLPRYTQRFSDPRRRILFML